MGHVMYHEMERNTPFQRKTQKEIKSCANTITNTAAVLTVQNSIRRFDLE